MAYRFQNSPKTTDRPPVYYANNRLYPGSYARADSQTRSSRRVHDGLNLYLNYGLDTVSDDVNSSAYSSPYYVNGRYISNNLMTQRGNSASIQGTSFLISYGDTAGFGLSSNNGKYTFTDEQQTSLKMWQGKQIKFEIPYNGKVVANMVRVKNTEACTGILSIYLSASDGGKILSETSIDLCKVSTDKFEDFLLRTMTPVGSRANPKGKLYVRMEIWDEIDLKERSENPFNTGKYIEIAATGKGNHYACEYLLNHKNMPANETYDYKKMPSRPLIGLVYNNYISVPVDRLGNEKTGASVSYKGYRYDIFCVKNDTEAKVLIYDKEMNRLVENTDIRIDSRVETMLIAQVVVPDAKEELNYVYYVDGHSPLQRFRLGTWQSEVVTPAVATVTDQDTGDTESCAPVVGASLIIHHNNRLYIGGFKNDPNLWQFSSIEKTGPDYTSFPYRFYSPNNSPYALSVNTPTAVIEYTSDQIMIIGKNFYSIFQTNVNVEALTSWSKDSASYPSQVSSFTDSVGVQAQGDVCNYKGVLYSFDPKEGIRRYSGAVWSVIPNSISSLFDRVDMSKRRKIWGFENKLYFNYTDKVDGIAKCLVWDMQMNYQQYPWFQDIEIPFCDVRYDESEELVGIHPDYPCIMRLYAEDVWRRLDTPITFERHTKYISMPGNSTDMIVKRVHNKIIANCNRWWYLALSVDKQDLTRYRGKDIWYRIPSYDTITVEEPVETPFPNQDLYEENAIERITMMNLHIQCSAIQEKIKCKTFRAQANLISTLFEAQVKSYL